MTSSKTHCILKWLLTQGPDWSVLLCSFVRTDRCCLMTWIIWGMDFIQTTLKINFPPHRKHYVSISHSNWLMLCRNRIAVYWKGNMKNLYKSCVQNSENLMLKQNVYVQSHDIWRLWNQRVRGYHNFPDVTRLLGDRGGTVVKVLCYKSVGHWFDPRWCLWNFSLT